MRILDFRLQISDLGYEISNFGLRKAECGLKRGTRQKAQGSEEVVKVVEVVQIASGLRPGGNLLLQDIVKLRLHAACLPAASCLLPAE